jgi:hypothetical protein
MIKAEIRSMVFNVLPKYDKTSKYTFRFIDACIEKAINSMYNDVFMESPLNLQRYTKGYGYTTAITVSTEALTGVKYSTLPESIVPFQDKSSGVRRISTIAQGKIMFLPMDFREMDLVANGSFFSTITTKIGYAVNQSRIEYFGMTSAIQSAGVRMDLIIPFSKYAETDEVKIPEITMVTGTSLHMMKETFMDRVLGILGLIRPVDLKDDNATEQVQTKES